MSKAVLISIHPEWCEKIASGEKTIEVRKTRPKLPTPFKCYIYMTKQKKGEDIWLAAVCADNRCYYGAGSVIGEFVCNKIFDIYAFSGSRFWLNEALLKDTCLSYDEIKKYAGAAEEIYGWHISDLVIYDKPMRLQRIYGYCGLFSQCETCGDKCPVRGRPPQSWCYVEELA